MSFGTETFPASVDGGLERLLEEGHALYRRDRYAVASVPYLDSDGKPQTGLLVEILNTLPDGRVAATPGNHQIYFVGGQPHDAMGREILSGSPQHCEPLFDGKLSNFLWSWKQNDASGQMRDYISLHEKLTCYINLLSGPAEQVYPEFSATPYAAGGIDLSESPFPFEDMNSARANLGELDKKLQDDKVAVIGVGGTGSYILDLISKTRVNSIRYFDFDVFDRHSAFRSPGATIREELGQPKVSVFERRLQGWHRGMVAQRWHGTASWKPRTYGHRRDNSSHAG